MQKMDHSAGRAGIISAFRIVLLAARSDLTRMLRALAQRRTSNMRVDTLASFGRVRRANSLNHRQGAAIFRLAQPMLIRQTQHLGRLASS
jgi:hypothetical protein